MAQPQSPLPASILDRIRRNEQRIADAGLTVEHRGNTWHVDAIGKTLAGAKVIFDEAAHERAKVEALREAGLLPPSRAAPGRN